MSLFISLCLFDLFVFTENVHADAFYAPVCPPNVTWSVPWFSVSANKTVSESHYDTDPYVMPDCVSSSTTSGTLPANTGSGLGAFFSYFSNGATTVPGATNGLTISSIPLPCTEAMTATVSLTTSTTDSMTDFFNQLHSCAPVFGSCSSTVEEGGFSGYSAKLSDQLVFNMVAKIHALYHGENGTAPIPAPLPSVWVTPVAAETMLRDPAEIDHDGLDHNKARCDQSGACNLYCGEGWVGAENAGVVPYLPTTECATTGVSSGVSLANFQDKLNTSMLSTTDTGRSTPGYFDIWPAQYTFSVSSDGTMRSGRTDGGNSFGNDALASAPRLQGLNCSALDPHSRTPDDFGSYDAHGTLKGLSPASSPTPLPSGNGWPTFFMHMVSQGSGTRLCVTTVTSGADKIFDPGMSNSLINSAGSLVSDPASASGLVQLDAPNITPHYSFNRQNREFLLPFIASGTILSSVLIHPLAGVLFAGASLAISTYANDWRQAGDAASGSLDSEYNSWGIDNLSWGDGSFPINGDAACSGYLVGDFANATAMSALHMGAYVQMLWLALDQVLDEIKDNKILITSPYCQVMAENYVNSMATVLSNLASSYLCGEDPKTYSTTVNPSPALAPTIGSAPTLQQMAKECCSSAADPINAATAASSGICAIADQGAALPATFSMNDIQQGSCWYVALGASLSAGTVLPLAECEVVARATNSHNLIMNSVPLDQLRNISIAHCLKAGLLPFVGQMRKISSMENDWRSTNWSAAHPLPSLHNTFNDMSDDDFGKRTSALNDLISKAYEDMSKSGVKNLQRCFPFAYTMLLRSYLDKTLPLGTGSLMVGGYKVQSMFATSASTTQKTYLHKSSIMGTFSITDCILEHSAASP